MTLVWLLKVSVSVCMPLVWLLKVSVCHWCGYLRCRYAIGVVTMPRCRYAIGVVT